MSTTGAVRRTRLNRGDWPSHLLGVLLGAVGVIGYLQWAPGGLVRDGNWVGLDFHVYYQAALALGRGEDIYRAGISPPYIYPPLLAALVTPLTWLPATAATITWKLLQHAWLLGAGALLVHLLPGRVRLLAAGVLLLGGLTPIVRDEIRVGQVNSLILLLEVGALWLIARRGRQDRSEVPPALVGAGGLLALAAGIKVLPGLLVAYFWGRGPRLVAAVATGGFLLGQALLWLLTPATGDYWLIHFPALFGEANPNVDNQSFNAAIARALLPGFDPGLPSPQLADGAAARPALTWLANGGLLFATVGVLARAARRPGNTAPPALYLLAEAGLVLITIHLVSGSTWLHHLVDLAVPLTALLGVGGWTLGIGNRALLDRRALLPPAGVALALALLIPRPATWIGWVAGLAPGNSLAVWLAGNMPLWVMLGLWTGIAALILQTQSSARPPDQQSVVGRGDARSDAADH